VNSIRYSVPVSWIGRRVEIRETRDKLAIELDPRHIVTHERVLSRNSNRLKTKGETADVENCGRERC